MEALIELHLSIAVNKSKKHTKDLKILDWQPDGRDIKTVAATLPQLLRGYLKRLLLHVARNYDNFVERSDRFFRSIRQNSQVAITLTGICRLNVLVVAQSCIA